MMQLIHRFVYTTLTSAAVVLGAGCGDSASPAADSTGTDAATTSGGGSGSSEAGSSESTTTGADDWPYDHGYVKVMFVPPADAPDAAVLDATATVVIAMDYGECLAAYYEANPFVRQDGDLGAPIFGDASMGGEGWKELLCSPLFGDHAQCSVVWITQRFDVVRSLTITFDILSDLATKPLFFGPLPTPATANCMDGLEPSVIIPTAMAIRGIDAMGDDLWEAESFVPDEAASRDDDPIVVTILPTPIE